MSCRKTDCGLIYLRRSGKRQETSLDTQLEWAIREAKRLGVRIDAAPADLQHMLDESLHSHKSLRLDNGITGSDPTRPGFAALNHDAVADPSISHALIFKRDRYSRPEDAVQAVQTEKKLRLAGITLAFSDKIVKPSQRGERDLAQDITALLDYHAAGEFLEGLAERMILTHRALAAEGYSTGGSPPYGHVRALFSPGGELSQILEKGRTIRQEGYHVRWIPGEDEENRAKIKIWVYILQLSESGWGGKRIASHLNALGIPSPGAGTVRKDRGVKHKVTGKWPPNTVLDLIRNNTIAAEKSYGVRSEGKHRRLSAEGWRILNDEDRRTADTTKVIRNSNHLVVKAASGAVPSFDPQRLLEIQAKLKERGTSQRGIPRAVDPTKYPLSGRIIDLSGGCGSLMYGATQSGRPLYKCGRYMRTSGAECDNNAVDAEALLRHVLGTFLDCARQLFSRSDLESELLKIANSQISIQESVPANERAQIDSRLTLLENDLALIGRNLARAKDQETYDAIERERVKVKADISDLMDRRQRLVGRAVSNANNDTTPQQEVEKALAQLKNLQRIASSLEGRTESRAMLDELGCRIGLGFVGAIKGKKRSVRKLAGGIIVFGDGELPVKLHGKDRIDDGAGGQDDCGGGHDGGYDDRARGRSDRASDSPAPCSCAGDNALRCSQAAADTNTNEGGNLPSATDVFSTKCHQEEVSFTKVSRADWIRTSDLLTPSQTRYQTALRPDG